MGAVNSGVFKSLATLLPPDRSGPATTIAGLMITGAVRTACAKAVRVGDDGAL
jgi:hypothetical protein